jgi:hypothetical protein
LAQNIVKLSFNVILKVELFCSKVPFFKNFTLCDVNNFDVILGNTFLDAYKVLHNEGRLKVHAKNGSKLMNLYVDYNFAFVEMGVNLVVLTSELNHLIFFILMFLRISQGEPKSQGVKQPLVCILDSLNKSSKVLTNKLPDILAPYNEVDHQIEVVPKSILSFKASHRLNQKELKALKTYNSTSLIEGIFGKTSCLMGHLSCLWIKRTS